MVRNFQKSGDDVMCGDKPETTEINKAEFDRTAEGLFNAGRYEEKLNRMLTDEEILMFTEGFIPATVNSEVEYLDSRSLSD